MNTELMQYAQTFEQEVLAYRNLSKSDFIKQFIDENYAWNQDDENTLVSDYFSRLDIEHYKNDENSYFEICLGYGWPNVYLNINTRWESVEYVISWGGDSYSIDLYETIIDIYCLDAYC